MTLKTRLLGILEKSLHWYGTRFRAAGCRGKVVLAAGSLFAADYSQPSAERDPGFPDYGQVLDVKLGQHCSVPPNTCG